MDHPQRVPAPDHRAGPREQHPQRRAAVLPPRVGPAVHPGRVPGRGLPLRPYPGAALLPGQLHQHQRGRLLRHDLRPGRRGPGRPGRHARRGPRARRFIGWPTFFNFGDNNSRPNKRIDTKISTALFRLPLGAIASGDQPTALPQRNLLRHLTWSIPSGQAIAGAAGLPVLGASNFPELKGYGVGLDGSTPLWYYILKEAELRESGLRLGSVGSLIVGEVFIGLLQLDPLSYLATNPSWKPTLPRRDGSTGDFRMVDLLTFAGIAAVR